MLEHLKTLSAGDRFWFWMCPEAGGDIPALLLQPLAEDPGMKKLNEQTQQLTLPLTASPFMGLGNVNSEGRFRFSGPLANATRLSALAGWVKQQVEPHPELARLKDSALLNISSAGTVRAIHEDPALWEGVPDVMVPGTLGESAMRLSRIRPGRPCWFWLAQNGPSNKPFLYLHAARKDPQGAAFAATVVRLRRRASSKGGEIRGLLQKTANGSVLLTTTDALEAGRAILHGLSEENAVLKALLSAALLVRTADGKVAEVIPYAPGQGDVSVDAAALESGSAGLELSGQTAVLEGLGEAGSKALFWFGISAEDDTPLLLLATDRDALKVAVKEAGKASKSVRGQVIRSKKGWLEFRTRTPYPGFITALGEWCRAHRPQWPALKTLTGARMICRNADGEIVDRQKNDNIWND